ncbi:MAG: DUF1080 domain-containing protein [Pirellulaceae bacterium]
MTKIFYSLVALLAVAVALQSNSTATAQESTTKPLSKLQIANSEERAKVGAEAVAKEMELSDEQKSLLESTLLTKYKNNASKIRQDMSNEARSAIWRESNTAVSEALADKFSKKEIRQVNQIVRKANEAGRIFNGKDLDGWEQVNGTATYEVIDGEIVGTTVAGSPNSFLATKKKYANFELRFEVFLVSDELNSGVQFRSAQHTEESLQAIEKKHPVGRVYGYQCELEASAEGDLDAVKYGDAGYIYDEARRGWLVDDETRLAATTRGAFKNQAWNRIKIVANGDHIQTWINGKKICDLKDEMTDSGFIALQVHGIGDKDEKWQVKWRNIFVKELP